MDSKLIGELLGLVAHDLRNPLSALHSNVGFLDSVVGDTSLDTKEAVVDGMASCDGLGHIIDNLDLFAEMLGQQAAPSVSTVSLSAFVNEVVGRCAQAARSHELLLVVEPSLEETKVELRTNHAMASRALANLVRNSIQHCPPGRQVTLGYREESSDTIVLSVRDPGRAIADEMRGAAFGAAAQVSTKSSASGRYSRGLGLLSVGIAAAAAGIQPRASEDEQGALFELVIPRA